MFSNTLPVSGTIKHHMMMVAIYLQLKLFFVRILKHVQNFKTCFPHPQKLSCINCTLTKELLTIWLKNIIQFDYQMLSLLTHTDNTPIGGVSIQSGYLGEVQHRSRPLYFSSSSLSLFMHSLLFDAVAQAVICGYHLVQ